MFKYRQPEIDHRTIKLLIGVIAISLPFITLILVKFAGRSLPSISDSYWVDDRARNVLVGFLYAIAAFLLAYNGLERREMFLSKAAAVSAFCVAMFPCWQTDVHGPSLNPHYAAATAMFVILTLFCRIFYIRAVSKRTKEANIRSTIYAACGWLIVLAMLGIGFGGLVRRFHFSLSMPGDYVFWGETVGLVAFGFSWLTASHVLLKDPSDRSPAPTREATATPQP